MSYGQKILQRVDAKAKGPEKKRYNFYLTISVVVEFVRKCGKRPVSNVLEELMIHFNETTPDPKK